jgi:preprotein translocase subunit YajC
VKKNKNKHMKLLSILLLGQPNGESGGSSVIIFWIAILAVFYFFMIRPQQQKQKKAKKFRTELKKGQNVVTIGGVHGRIAEVQENAIILDVEKGAKLKVDISAISYESAASEQELAKKS